MKIPLISVLVITYNHEQYIAQCLNSICSQICDFNFEIVVCNDASTDGTGEICKKVAAENERLRYFEHKSNLGVSRNFEFGLKECQGSFIAFCDGDDYWTDNAKLTKMLRAMDAHPMAGLVYSDAGRLDQKSGQFQERTLQPQPTPFTLADMLEKLGPAMNSMMVRKQAIPTQIPKEFHSVVNPDIFIHLWALEYGYGHYLNEPMSVYRIHSGGVWSPLQQPEKSLIHWSSRIIALRTKGAKHMDLIETCMDQLTPLLATCLRQGNKVLFKKYFVYLSLKRRLEFWSKRIYYRVFVRK